MKNRDIHLASEKKHLSFVLALLMHVLLLLFLFVGVRWQNQPLAPLEAEIWGGLPTQLPREGLPPAPAPEEMPQQISSLPDSPPVKAVETKPVEVVPVVPEIVEEKPKEEKKLKDALKERVLDKPLNKQEKKPKATQVVFPKKTENKKLSDNPLDLQHLLQRTSSGKLSHAAGNLQGSAAGADRAAQTVGGGKAGALEGYVNQLTQLIRNKTIYADNGTGNPSAVLKIFVLPDGTIREVQIISTAGDPAFAAARKQAVLMMQRLPPLPAGMSFAEQREWTVRTRLRE
jgi:colicin import membrane protein